jgi:hypothetical protein
MRLFDISGGNKKPAQRQAYSFDRWQDRANTRGEDVKKPCGLGQGLVWSSYFMPGTVRFRLFPRNATLAAFPA